MVLNVSKDERPRKNDGGTLPKPPVFVRMRVDRGTLTLTVEGKPGNMLLLKKRLDEVQALLLEEDSLKGCEVFGNITRFGPSTAVRVITVERPQGDGKSRETQPVSGHLYEVRF